MKYALRNLIRLPKKSILLLLLLFSTFFLVMWSNLITALCGTAIEKEIGDMDGSVRAADNDGNVPLSLAILKDIAGGFDIITGYDAVLFSSCDMEGISAIQPPKDEHTPSVETNDLPFGLAAVTQMNAAEDKIHGTIRLKEGTWIETGDNTSLKCKAVISDTLAEIGGFRLGDTISLVFRAGEKDKTVTQSFVIGGIYTYSESFETNVLHSSQLPDNRVYIPLDTYTKVTGQASPMVDTFYYWMRYHDNRTVEKLQNRLHEVGFDVVLTPFTAGNMTAGLNDLMHMAQIAAVILMMCGILAVFITLLLIMNTRMTEFGMLAAIGKSRLRIAGDFFLELAVTALAAFGIGILFFTLTANAAAPALGTMLRDESLGSGFTNTTADQFFSDIEAMEKQFLSIRDYMLRPVCVSCICLAVLALVGYGISCYKIAKMDVMQVMGKETG